MATEVVVAAQRRGNGGVGHRQRENNLLRCIARKELAVAGVAELRHVLQDPLDWDYLLATAHRHSVLPLLYRHLKRSGWDLVPQPAAEQLTAAFHRISRRNLQMTGELLRLLKLFDAQGIVAMPYKGPVLARYLYGNIALRTYSDLDILIRAADVARVQAVMLSAGYRDHLALSAPQLQALLRHSYHQAFHAGDGETVVEIHWGLVVAYDPLPLQVDALWQHLATTDLLGTTVPTIAPEDLLLLLCVHGTKHRWDRLEWIAGVGELLRQAQGMDWPRVTGRARQLACERRLLTGCLLAHQLLAAPLPPELTGNIRCRPLVHMLAAAAGRRLFPANERPPGHVLAVVYYFLYYVAAMDRLRDQVRYCVDFAITPSTEDYARLDLPAAWYYLLRPCRLVAKYVLGVIR